MEKEQLKLNIGICDDEPAMVEQLEKLCRDTLEMSYSLQIDKAVSVQELLAKPNPFQIAILDVQLLECTGIELARQILERNPRCRILFVSGFLHAVSEVYEVPHFCFALKDRMEKDLPRFLRRAADLCAAEAGKSIMVACGKKMEQVLLTDLTVLERRGHWTYLYRTDGSVMETREKLADFLERIRSSDFIRCHVSYAVNLEHTLSMDGRTFVMDSGDLVPVSRPNENQCRVEFFRYLGENMA